MPYSIDLKGVTYAMTKVNDPGKESDDDQDRLGSNSESQGFENDIRINGFRDDDSSSDDELDDELHENGYQLLPQDVLPSIRDAEEADFANFERHFQDAPIDDSNKNVEGQPLGNPSIQTMIQQAHQEHKKEELQERKEIFNSSTPSSEERRMNTSLCMDNSKIETIKASMEKVKLNSAPPKWLQEMSDDEWNKMLEQKLKK